MNIYNFLALLGGLALFLYGMQMMSSGLEAAAGNKMKQILERLTANRIIGVLVGALITAIIQSSSATTVMVVGFVNSGMMTLKQAVWIIMGANIGTTITGQLIALNVEAVAPLFAFIGVAAIVFLKSPKIHNIGLILAGLGVLFIGMNMMGDAMVPLRESEAFISLMTRFSNPALGILAGMIFTAIIQSSSASVGILQTLAIGGLIGLDSAVYVLFGQNIGTCITAVLASIGTGRNAKRTTIIHLSFNIIGTAIFTAVCMALPLADWVASWTPDRPAAQIANMHTLFNVVTTLLLLPFGSLLVKLARKILPDKADELGESRRLVHIAPRRQAGEVKVGTSAIALESIRMEVMRMAGMVRENVSRGFACIQKNDDESKLQEEMREREDYIDFLNKEISQFVSDIVTKEKNEADAQKMTAYFKLCSDLERIGDHASNLQEYAMDLKKYSLELSDEAMDEVRQMQQMCEHSLKLVTDSLQDFSKELFTQIVVAEEKIDDMTDDFRKKQFSRMRKGHCSGEAGILYSEVLTDFERIGDHILNIGEGLMQIHMLQ